MADSILNNRQEIEKIDTEKTLSSIEQVGNQVQQVWEAVQKINFPASYAKANHIVVAGMGGSVLGTHVIQTVFKDTLEIPITIVPDYEMPAFVNESTLVIGASYSGNTEETLSAFNDALARGAMATAVTSGGKLAQLCNEKNIPALVFDGEHNPAKVSRMGLGYSIFGQMAVLAKIGIISIGESEYKQIMECIAEQHLRLSVAVEQNKNMAKILAFELFERTPVIAVAEHLEGVAHVFANQLHENAKTFADYKVIPEMHHHLLESFEHPSSFQQKADWLLIDSELYHQSNQHRMKLTGELLTKYNVAHLSHELTSQTKLTQAFELLMLSAYTAFYLAMLYNENPTPNPNVDWLKSNLKAV